jgi:hypothetical protein
MKTETLTSAEMSKALAARGIVLGSDAVRRWWQRGAPRTDDNAFLEFYERNRTSNRPPQLCQGAPVYDLLKKIRLLPHPDKLRAAADRLLDELEIEAESSAEKELRGPGKDRFFFAVSVKRACDMIELVALFAVGIDGGLEIPDEMRREHETVVKNIDWPKLWRDLGLPGNIAYSIDART